MSKNITIQEGNRGRNFTAGKLKTVLQGGGSCLWVPEDETKLDNVDIDKNGTVTAASKGVYGFDEVYVYVPGAGVSGTDPDTGGDIWIGPGGEETLPTSIAIGIQPVRLEYVDGERISIYGMSVYAYDAQGNRWEGAGYPNGLIPNGELSISPQVADAEEAGGGDEGKSSQLDTSPFPNPVPCSTTRTVRIWNERSHYYDLVETIAGGMLLQWKATDYMSRWVLVVGSPGTYNVHYKTITDDGTVTEGDSSYTISEPGSHYSHDGKTAWWYGGLDSSSYKPVEMSPLSKATIGGGINGKTAWTALYGTKTGGDKTQTIAVSWPRPMDGKVLSTTFEITVQS